MTNPKITYGHGYCNDFSLTEGADWTTEGGSGNTVAATFGYKGDYLDLNCTVATGAKTYYIQNNTNIGLSTIIYPTILFRYMTTSNAKAKIVAVFSDASTQTILDDTENTSWTASKATLTTSKTLDHLQLYADSGTGHVYYDFTLVCTGQFTFPQWTRLNVQLPNFYSKTRIPSKVTNRNSYMGADDAQVTLNGDIDDQNTDWIIAYSTVADILFILQHRAYSEPFQWFNSDRGNFKVVIDNAEMSEEANSIYKYSYILMMHEYSRANKANEYYQQRFGLTGVTT
ncbi:MAG: hypothetical protein WC325_08460 [Candidatus Bathyarchaeia archaeon]|jgi:hypothetical protein